MIEEFIGEVERSLGGTPSERSDMVAMLRSHLLEAEAAGVLLTTLDGLGSPREVATKFGAAGVGHRHLDAVRLPDGTTVWAASFRDDYARLHLPAFGLYFDARWQPPWPHTHIEWPDFGLPASPADMIAALDAALRRAEAGELVELGCLGGHGRTGTALACLAVLSGLDNDPVEWVRTNYCVHAIETDDQAAFVRGLQRPG
jgi:hypothetical protein